MCIAKPSKTMTAFVSQVVNEGSRSYFYTFSVDRGQRISPHRYAFVTKKKSPKQGQLQ